MNNFNDLIKSTQFTVQEASYATVGDFWKDMVYFYKHNRIYYVTQGEAELYLKNLKIPLRAGHLYFIPAYSVVTAKCNSILSHYYVHFELNSMLNNILNSLKFDYDILASSEDEYFFKLIMANMDSDTPYSLLSINGALQILLAKFLKNAITLNTDILRFSDTINFIEQNINNKITIKELASKCNLNEVYFSNMFTKAFGIPPLQYIINKKINNSMTLLRKGYSVKETAFALGFNDEMYFSRLFKLKIGISPTFFKNLKD